MSTHPAESTADASQLGGLPTVLLKLGCFNCGIDQAMLSKDVHQKSLRRVIAKAVVEQDLHMVSLCEVGGHKQGLEKSKVRAQDPLAMPPGRSGVAVNANGTYVAHTRSCR